MSGFLKNSGNIVVDAVLTDEGRKRIAKGDGSFNISSFALGDDEINYRLFNLSHPSGSKFADLNIRKTPILEAITNSSTALKYKLLTLEKQDILYLPSLILNTKSATAGVNAGKPQATGTNAGFYVVLCTQAAFDAYSELPQGYIDGRNIRVASQNGQLVVLDQGIDSTLTNKSFNDPLDSELEELQFVISVDDRFGKIVTPAPQSADAIESFVDQDNVATYFIAKDPFAPSSYFAGVPNLAEGDSDIDGPRGERFKFGIRASNLLANGTGMFTRFGTTISSFFTGTGIKSTYSGTTTAMAIDTVIRISGNTTGLTLDIPIRFIREEA